MVNFKCCGGHYKADSERVLLEALKAVMHYKHLQGQVHLTGLEWLCTYRMLSIGLLPHHITQSNELT